MKSLKYLYRIGFGPSSSHTMGPQYAAEYMLKNFPNANKFEVILYGSLALTGKGHLTDFVLLKTLGNNKTTIKLDISSDIPHPNTLNIKAYKDDVLLKDQRFISLGGGAIDVEGIDSEKEAEIYPFKSFKEILDYSSKNNISLAEIVYKFEGEEIKEYLKKVYQIMDNSIEEGVKTKGTLPGGLGIERKAPYLQEFNGNDNELLIIQRISKYAYAVSEQNASGGLIVTAPTCGACGVLPAVLRFAKEKYNFDIDKMIDGLAVAALIGNIIKQNASISGAFAGCQAEIGSACSMAAGALSFLCGYDNDAVACAAEIAMEHHLGLTCDPVNGLVQVPCIERNAAAALRALDASALSLMLSKTNKVSFDKIVQTMLETGKALSSEYKETSKGGLAVSYHC